MEIIELISRWLNNLISELYQILRYLMLWWKFPVQFLRKRYKTAVDLDKISNFTDNVWWRIWAGAPRFDYRDFIFSRFLKSGLNYMGSFGW